MGMPTHTAREFRAVAAVQAQQQYPQQPYMQSTQIPSPAPYSALLPTPNPNHNYNPSPTPRRPSQQKPSLAPALAPHAAGAGFEESNPMHTSARYSRGSLGALASGGSAIELGDGGGGRLSQGRGGEIYQ